MITYHQLRWAKFTRDKINFAHTENQTVFSLSKLLVKCTYTGESNFINFGNLTATPRRLSRVGNKYPSQKFLPLNNRGVVRVPQ